MPRARREQVPDGIFHAMNRGLNRRAIVKTDASFALFKECLAEVSERFEAIILAFCLMTNHYHLVIRTPLANLSEIMRHFGFVYTQRFNKQANRDGPLFRGRFRSIWISDEIYLKQVVRYVHLNPVQAGIVERAKDYGWSSHPAYLSKKELFPWLHRRFVLGSFGEPFKLAQKRFNEFVDAGNTPELQSFYSRKHLNPKLSHDTLGRAYSTAIQKACLSSCL